tara:strand:- start:970 stop:2070 length:1101 start_codon:yes stop_codon:yes gene_type:complete
MVRVKQLTSPELRRLIKAHNKLVTIKIPVGTKRAGLIKLIEDNGYKVDHANKKIIPTSDKRVAIDLPAPPVRRTKEEVEKSKKERRKRVEKKEEEAFEKRKMKISTIKETRKKVKELKKKKEEEKKEITKAKEDLEKRKELKKFLNENKTALGQSLFDKYNKEVTKSDFNRKILNEVKEVLRDKKERAKFGLSKEEAKSIIEKNNKLFYLLTQTQRKKQQNNINENINLLELEDDEKKFFDKFRKESKDNYEAWKKFVSFAKNVVKGVDKPEKKTPEKEEPKKKSSSKFTSLEENSFMEIDKDLKLNDKLKNALNNFENSADQRKYIKKQIDEYRNEFDGTSKWKSGGEKIYKKALSTYNKKIKKN